MTPVESRKETERMDAAPDRIDFVDRWRVIRKRRKVILYLFLISVIGTAAVSLILPPIYRAKATLIPVESSQNRFSAAMGALQNVPFLGGAVSEALGKTTTDKLVTILNSRTVAENVIQKLDLIKIFFQKKWDQEGGKWKNDKPPTMLDTVRILQKKIMKVSEDRKGLISITVEYEDPQVAAAIANEYTAVLHKFLNVNAISLAKRNRIFLEKQLAATKADLARAEEELKGYQTEKKIMALEAQAEGAVKALAEMKAQIVAREIQLGAMREFAGKEHPEVMRVEDELREFRRQLKRLETGSKTPGSDASIGAMITLKDAPSVNLGHVRLKRDALIEQKVFELLTQQYELAKIEEAKDEITFQVIDPAVPPEERIRPKRALNVILAGLASLFLGAIVVFSQEYLERQRSGKNR